jgi:hypothetical protein
MGKICVERNYHDSPLTKAYLGSTDTIYTSDINAIVKKSSNKYILMIGGTTAATEKVAGYIYKMPQGATHCSGGSTIAFWVRKFSPDKEYEIEYSTLYSTVHPATSDYGNFIGVSTAATDVGGRLDMDTVVNDAATSSGAGRAWFQISGFSTARRKIYGFPYRNSSCIAW